MQIFHDNPTFTVYVITCLVLCGNLLFLWGYSGGVRGGTKTTLNPEDTAAVVKGGTVVEADPPAVARVLRAHANASANIYPFLVLGLLYVLLGGPAMNAKIYFGVFTAARLLHSLVYLAGKQPFRTLSFVLGALTTLVMMGDIVRLLLK